jgi:hypothetical protein
MQVPRSSQREFCSDNGGGGSFFGDPDRSPPRSQPPLPRLEHPPATPLHLDFDDDVPVSRPATRVPADEGLGRGMRQRRENSKYCSQDWDTYQENLKQKVSGSVLTDAVLQSLDWDMSVALLKSVDFQAFSRANEVNGDPEDGCDEWLHPFSLAAQANASSADTPNWYQDMNGVHADGYKESMQVEYETLLSKNAWTEVKREK